MTAQFKTDPAEGKRQPGADVRVLLDNGKIESWPCTTTVRLERSIIILADIFRAIVGETVERSDDGVRVVVLR